METERLPLRGLTDDDFEAVKHIMNSPHVTEVWRHSFGDDDVRGWITRNRQAHMRDGFGYMLACDKQTGEPVGQAGLLHEALGSGRWSGSAISWPLKRRAGDMLPKWPGIWPDMP